MPQKKKKKTASNWAAPTTTVVDSQNQQDDADQKDVLACLDELDTLVSVASISETDCIVGIKKADRALELCERDGDLQCAILMKRAQLLKSVVEKRYSTAGLPAHHRRPLDSCIADCQEVLSSLKSSGSSTMYQEAQTLATHAKKLKRDNDHDVRTRTGAVTVTQSQWTSITTPQRYHPEKTLFKDISKINPVLLQDVVNCYKRYKFVCRMCFFRHNRQETLHSGKPCRQCKNTAAIRVIPASRMCKNFRDLKVLAIPPPPKMLMTTGTQHKPFQYCRNVDHMLCYDRAKESWYAHSIEEIVIWTVERYWGCSFMDYIKNHHVSTSPGSKVTSKNQDAIDSFSDDLSEKDYEYHPSEVTFPRGLASIPKHLLDDIVKCYSEMKEYCKVCFYKHGKKGEISIGPKRSFICKLCNGAWECVVVIPSSSLCWNFGDFDLLPVAPWPRSKPSQTPFEYCRKDDHYRCFRVYFETEFWYVHSVEELVIWTVEREKDCTFAQFVNKALRPSLPPPGLALSSSPSKYTRSPPTQSQSVPIASGKRGPTTGAGIPSPLSRSPLSPSSPSFSQVVAAGSPSKSGPPPAGLGGKFNVWNRERVASAAGAEPISPISNSSLDQVIMTSPPPSGIRGSRNPPYQGVTGSLTQPVQSGHESSLDNFVTAVSHTTFSSSQDNYGSAQDRGHSDPNKSRMAQSIKSSKAHLIKGCTNYKIANSSNQVMADDGNKVQSETVMTGAPNVGFVASQPLGVSTPPSSSNYGYSARDVDTVNTNNNQGVTSAGAGTSERGNAAPQNGASKHQEVFTFPLINFRTFSDIPLRLIVAVAMAFQERREVCRKCFYGERSLSYNEGVVCGEGQHQWDNPIVVIPGCKECNNQPCFDSTDYLPLPPLPPIANIRKCSQKNHHKCFQKCLNSNPKFAHSVEELVVWIVESEKDCAFADFIKSELQSLWSVQRTETHHINKTGPMESSNKSAALESPSAQMGHLPGQVPHQAPQVPRQTPIPVPVTGISHLPNVATPHSAPQSRPLPAKYDARNVTFQHIQDIPQDLLMAVALCYKFHKVVCRQCFFSSGCTQLTAMQNQSLCLEGHHWRPLIIMPGCRLCLNFTTSWHIPVLPIPKHMKDATSPFCICKKEDHQQCYQMSKSTNPWFPHTVEELVIWTVERERSVPFESVYKSYLPSDGATISPDTVMFLKPSPSSLSPSARTGRRSKEMETRESGQAEVGVAIEGVASHSLPVESLHNVVHEPNVGSNQSNHHLSGAETSDVSATHVNIHVDNGDFSAMSSQGMPSSANPEMDSTTLDPVPNPLMQQTNDGGQDSNGSETTGMSLFQDPLMYYVSSSNGPAVPDPSDFNSDISSATLEYFPALKETVSGIVSNDSITHNATVEDTLSRSVNSQGPDFGDYSGDSSKPKRQGSIPITPLLNEQFDNADHYKYRSSTSSTLPENWPDVPSEISNAREISQLPNDQGQDPSTPHNSQASAGFDIEQGALVGENLNVNSANEIEETSNTAGSGLSVEDNCVVSESLARRDSLLDANAKEFTPKVDSPGLHPAATPPTYPSGLNPNATSYTYPTNGAQSLNSTVLTHVGSKDDGGGIDSASITCDSSLCCFLCYLGFPDPVSLTRHCKTEAHVSAVLCDCGAPAIWKHMPPPPGQHQQWKLCPNGKNCAASCLECRQPHFADELVEWHHRIEHRTRRKETGLQALPEFSDQQEGLLISPQEDITHYSSLRVSIVEPLQAVLNDASDSFTWTVTVKGENWQTLFGIHIKSSTTHVFHITDLEDANRQSSGNSQNDSVNWAVLSPDDAILLGKLSFSVRATPDKVSENYSCQVCLNLGFRQYVYISLALIVKDPKYDQPVPLATSLPLQQEQPLIGESMITAEQLEPQKPIDIEEPSLGMTSGSIASDPILQNSLQSVVNSKLGVPDSLSPDPLQISSSALGEVVELNEMRSKSPTREGSVPQWQMSDSDDDDLGIEAEDTTLHHEPIEDQIYSLTDHLASDEVTSMDIHVQSNTDI